MAVVVAQGSELAPQERRLAGDVLDLVAGATGLPSGLSALNRTLTDALGISVTTIALADRGWRTATGAEEPDALGAAAIAAWRQSREPDDRGPVPWEGALLVPVAVGRRVVGLARIAAADPAPDAPARDAPAALDAPLLRAVGAACAALVRSAYLSSSLAHARAELAHAAERTDASAEVRHAVDRVLEAIEARLGAISHSATHGEWQSRFDDLAGIVLRGRREIDRATHLPELLDARRKPGIAPSLRELGRRFERLTGTRVRVEVRGERDVVPLPPSRERALFRAACEALIGMDVDARASILHLVLTYEDEDGAMVLSARDDGTGLAHRDPFGRHARNHGLARLRQLVEPERGTVEIRNLQPHGVAVECRMPRTRSTRSTRSRRKAGKR